MNRSRRGFLAATSTLLGSGAISLYPSQSEGGLFRNRRCRTSQYSTGQCGRVSGADTIERGLNAALGRPGTSNPGQRLIREDSRKPGERAVSLHLGVNWVDPMHYGQITQLAACLYDAQRMQRLAEQYGFVTNTLTNTFATTKSLKEFLTHHSERLEEGDVLLITYAGHGSNIDDSNGDEGPLRSDQTWCLFDRMLIDDEIWAEFVKFKDGVRILFILDSCHSGSAIRSMSKARSLRADAKPSYQSTFGSDPAAIDYALEYLNGTDPLPLQDLNHLTLPQLRLSREPKLRTLRNSDGVSVYVANEELYQKIEKDVAHIHRAEVRAATLLLAACQDGQVAHEVGSSGAFTAALLRALAKSSATQEPFPGTYDQLLEAVKKEMGGTFKQTPELFKEGDLTTLFRNERPFDLQRRFTVG